MNVLYLTTEHINELVAPIPNEPQRYYVKSNLADEKVEVCDLTYLQGNGMCSCEDFYFKKRININNGAHLHTLSTLCKHLILTHAHWDRNSTKDVAKILNDQSKPL
jgi:hypothetical protein